MSRTLLLFSSDLERDAAFPEGIPSYLMTAVSGVGLIDAAVGTTRVVIESNPDTIIFLGTCGAHRASGIESGDLLLATDVRIGSGDVAIGAMRFPTLLRSSLRVDRDLNEMIASVAVEKGLSARLRRGSVSCTLGVTESDELAGRLREHDGSDAENLEAFALLRAAGTTPTAILLGVTNMVGAGGGKDWVTNYRTMMALVGELGREIALRGLRQEEIVGSNQSNNEREKS